MFKKLKALAVGLFAAVSLAAQSAYAAVDAAVTTAISTGVTDAATIGGLMLAFIVGIAVFRHLRSAK